MEIEQSKLNELVIVALENKVAAMVSQVARLEALNKAILTQTTALEKQAADLKRRNDVLESAVAQAKAERAAPKATKVVEKIKTVTKEDF